MSDVRILVVDDSVVNRQMLKKTLSEISGFDVVAVASNGRFALAKIEQMRPDIVILDFEMPEMDGLETLTHIREKHGDLPVIMFSALTATGADITLQALALGADDYVTKPQVVPDIEKIIKKEFEPRIRALCHRRATPRPEKPIRRMGSKTTILTNEPIRALGIGISTGGPNALMKIIPRLKADFPVPIFIVQHMPPVFTQSFAERLNQVSQVTVVEAKAQMLVQPGWVYIAPGNYHMEVSHSGRLVLHQGPPENSCRPAADVLFRSLARVYGAGTLGVVMTGMGQDGFKGVQVLKEAGASIFVQDEATSTIWGMPGYVAKAGLADEILPLDSLVPSIQWRVMRR